MLITRIQSHASPCGVCNGNRIVTLMQLFLGTGYVCFPLSESFHQCSIVKPHSSIIGAVLSLQLTKLSNTIPLCLIYEDCNADGRCEVTLFSNHCSVEISNSEMKTESPSLFQEQPNERLLLRYSP